MWQCVPDPGRASAATPKRETNTLPEANESGAGWQRWALCAALALAAVLVWYTRIVAPASILATGPALDANSASDLQLYSYGMWRRGPPRSDGLWLWNPYQLAGHPYLATLLNGVLYPPAWLARLLPLPQALEASNVFHMAAAGIFSFLYARAISLGTVAALLAAISFMFSGFIGGESAWFTPAVGSAIWLPLGMLAIDKLFATQRIVWSVPLALAVGMPVLSGWVQSWVYSIYLLGGYSALRIGLLLRASSDPKQAFKLASLAAFGAIAGVALAAGQLLPSLELMSLGPRAADSLSLNRILALGAITPIELIRQATDGTPGFGRFAYVGLTALALAPLACLGQASRFRALFLAGAALFAFGVVAASSFDFFELYLYFPGGGLFRKPQRILYLWAFAMSILSAIALDSLYEKSSVSDRARLGALAVGGIFVLGVAALAGSLQLRSALCLAAALLAAAAVVVTAGPLRKLASIVLLVAVLIDLVGALRNPYMHPIHETASFNRAAHVLDYVVEHQGYHRTYIHDESYFRHSTMPKQGTLRGIYAVRDYEPLSTQQHKEFFAAIEDNPSNAPKRFTFTGGLIAHPERSSFRMLDLLSVRYALTHKRSKFETEIRKRRGWRRVKLAKSGAHALYERIRLLPRAYLAPVSRPVATREQALQAVSAAGFNPWREVVVEEQAAGAKVHGRGAPIAAARIVSYEPERVVVAVEGGAGHLVLTDSYYPGWQASVDGVPVEIKRANGLFRAVPVADGAQQVVFEYRPTSARAGFALSLGSLGLLLGILLFGRRASARD